ncbi:MAG: hypothetical protein QNJ31_02125 [Candidatus Caenarcaniphilales bacterium]|nr:hypothetical protein [Candidatus Caenarcaniphilales bacterium]
MITQKIYNEGFNFRKFNDLQYYSSINSISYKPVGGSSHPSIKRVKSQSQSNHQAINLQSQQQHRATSLAAIKEHLESNNVNRLKLAHFLINEKLKNLDSFSSEVQAQLHELNGDFHVKQRNPNKALESYKRAANLLALNQRTGAINAFFNTPERKYLKSMLHLQGLKEISNEAFDKFLSLGLLKNVLNHSGGEHIVKKLQLPGMEEHIKIHVLSLNYEHPGAMEPFKLGLEEPDRIQLENYLTSTKLSVIGKIGPTNGSFGLTYNNNAIDVSYKYEGNVTLPANLGALQRQIISVAEQLLRNTSNPSNPLWIEINSIIRNVPYKISGTYQLNKGQIKIYVEKGSS